MYYYKFFSFAQLLNLREHSFWGRGGGLEESQGGSCLIYMVKMEGHCTILCVGVGHHKLIIQLEGIINISW